MAKRKSQKELRKEIEQLTKAYWPSEILSELAVLYRKNQKRTNGEENDFWFKCSRACDNLSSGMEKWFDDMDEEDG